MNPVREFVTRLSFKFDRNNLDKFEHSLIGFKTRVGIAFGAISLGIKKVFDQAQIFSNKILTNDSLATLASSTLQRVTAFQNAFAKFNIPTEVFQNFFQFVTEGILEASRGVDNGIFKIVREARGALVLDENGQLVSFENFIQQILNYLHTAEDDANRIRIIKNLFGVDIKTAGDLKKFFDQTNQELIKLIELEFKSAEYIKDANNEARQFQKDVAELSNEWDKFNNKVQAFVAPHLTNFVKSLNQFVKEGESKGFQQTAIENATKFNFLFGRPKTEEELNKEVSSIEKTVNKNNNLNSSNMIMNNNIEINVPPGTENGQATVMAEEVKKVIYEANQEMVRHIFNNNPQVE